MQIVAYVYFLVFSTGSLFGAQLLVRADALKEPYEIKDISGKVENLENFEANQLTLETDVGNISLLHIDRNSDYVLILGQGLPAPKESMLCYAAKFKSYDIIMFDYHWVGCYSSFLLKSILKCGPVKKVLLDGEQIVRHVIGYAQDKGYHKIAALGVCYSNFLFTKIQADDMQATGEGPFSHLILDSCWHSVHSFAERIAFDPYLPTSPQHGGAPGWLTTFSRSRLGAAIAHSIMWLLSNPSVSTYLPNIDCPVLFIHGAKDLMVPIDQFNLLWQAATPYNRVALVTPAAHAENISFAPEYTHVVEQFIESDSIDEFLEAIVD